MPLVLKSCGRPSNFPMLSRTYLLNSLVTLFPHMFLNMSKTRALDYVHLKIVNMRIIMHKIRPKDSYKI